MNVKRKGTHGEHELENLLQEHGIRAYRNDQIFKGGSGNPDVFAEIAGKPLHIEVKRCEKLNIHAAMEQAKRDAKENHLPIVAHRRNREKWLVTMPLAELIDMLEGSTGNHDGAGIQSGRGCEQIDIVEPSPESSAL